MLSVKFPCLVQVGINDASGEKNNWLQKNSLCCLGYLISQYKLIHSNIRIRYRNIGIIRLKLNIENSKCILNLNCNSVISPGFFSNNVPFVLTSMICLSYDILLQERIPHCRAFYQTRLFHFQNHFQLN